jgi:hypothetical protein
MLVVAGGGVVLVVAQPVRQVIAPRRTAMKITADGNLSFTEVLLFRDGFFARLATPYTYQFLCPWLSCIHSTCP